MRAGHALALIALAFAACTDGTSVPTLTDPEVPPVASAISDADPTADPQSEYPIYFLSPLVKGRSPMGTFNPNLAPEIAVCELTGADGVALSEWTCVDGDPAVYFGPGIFAVDPVNEVYQFNWNTDLEGPLDHTKLYRVQVVMGDIVLGFFDINPQDPSGETPGEDETGLHAFRLGETLPIKFWLASIDCQIDGRVVECNEWSVYREQGAQLALVGNGAPIGVDIRANSLPVDNPVVTFRLERIELGEGESCIPGLDVPTFGPCLHITTIPEELATGGLLLPNVIAVCEERESLRQYLADENSLLNIQMFRLPSDGSGPEALKNVNTWLCPDDPEPEPDGLMGMLARVFRPVTRLVAPQPLRAIHLGRGGELGEGVTGFSYYTWGLPAQLTILSGDNQFGDANAYADPAPVVKVVDDGGYPVQGATVHFEVLAGDGTVMPASGVSGSDGTVTASWQFGPLVGANVLEAWGYGLFGEGDDFIAHESEWAPDRGSVFFNATACAADGSNLGTATVDGVLSAEEWGCAFREPYEFTANLGSGGVPAELYWMNDADNLYLAVKVYGADKVNALRFDFDNDGDGVTEALDDAVNYDPATDTYVDAYITEKCSQSNQSGCGESDASAGGTNDGMVKFTNVDGVTVYELMKPLNSGDGYDFAYAPGEAVKLFGTLRLGNGAKGNTQFPGFRDWFTIMLANPGS